MHFYKMTHKVRLKLPNVRDKNRIGFYLYSLHIMYPSRRYKIKKMYDIKHVKDIF